MSHCPSQQQEQVQKHPRSLGSSGVFWQWLRWALSRPWEAEFKSNEEEAKRRSQSFQVLVPGAGLEMPRMDIDGCSCLLVSVPTYRVRGY